MKEALSSLLPLFSRRPKVKTVYSVDVYIDTKSNILIVPSAKREDGFRVDANHPQKLAWEGNNYLELGEKFLEAYRVSVTHPPIKQDEAVDVWTAATGIKSWSRFAREHQMVSVVMVKEDPKFKIEFWKRQSDNSFGNDMEDVVPNRELPENATAEEIGHAIIDVYTEAGVLE